MSPEQNIFTLGHSPDPDDAFMFYAMAENKIDLRGYRFEHRLEDIQTLNERALRGELHISAISIHAYAYAADKYALLPCGASMGDGYGPIVVRKHPASNSESFREQGVELSFDPFSYQKRASETIERDGVRLGGEELIRVVVRQTNFDKIAHKIDKMGDYKPEIIYENAQIAEIDPRDESAIARLNASDAPRFVTVKNDIGLSVIAAFRLLAAKLQPRHSILLKDMLCSSAANDEALRTKDEGSPNDQITKKKVDTSLRDSGFVIPSSLDIRHSSLPHDFHPVS